MYTYHDYKIVYINVDFLYCETEDLSTAYKAVIIQKGTVNTNYCKQVLEDLCNLERIHKCKLEAVKIIGDALDRRAYLYIKMLQESTIFPETEFEFTDKKFPKPGLKLYFYVNGKILYIDVADEEYQKGDYFTVEELKNDMSTLYPDVPKSQLVPFYVRDWVPFTNIPDYVEEAYDKYLDIISESGEESFDYTIRIKPNGTRAYEKTRLE